MAYYKKYGHAQAVKEGDKYGYDYYAHVRQGQLWAMYEIAAGGFSANIGAEAGLSSMWREGLWEKGLFLNENAGGDRGKTSLGNSDKINNFTQIDSGYFVLRDVDFPENTRFIVSSIGKNGKSTSHMPILQNDYFAPVYDYPERGEKVEYTDSYKKAVERT